VALRVINICCFVFFSKGDHDGAIKQYIKTIGHLEPSYVIRKVLHNVLCTLCLLAVFTECNLLKGVFNNPELVNITMKGVVKSAYKPSGSSGQSLSGFQGKN